MTGPRSLPGTICRASDATRSMTWSVFDDGDHDRRRHAALPAAAGGRGEDVGAGHLGVGVGQHDQVILGAAQGQDPLEVAGAAAVDRLGHRGRADEAHRRDIGVVADGLDDVAAAVHDAEDAGRQSGLAQQLGDAPRRERHPLRRLEHQAVAQRDRVGDRPVGHHRGEVERRDRRHDAQRHALDAALHAPAHFHHLAGGDLGQGTGELGELHRLEDLRLRLAVELAVLFDDEVAQLLEIALEQGSVAVEDLDPLLDRGPAPCREGAPCGGHRRIHLGPPAEGDLRDHLAGGGVVDIAEGRGAVGEGAADIVLGRRVLHEESRYEMENADAGVCPACRRTVNASRFVWFSAAGDGKLHR